MSEPNQPDQDLRAVLRSADPAASLTPLEHDRITRMVNTTSSQPAGAPGASRRPRRRPVLLGLAGAAGVAAAAFAVVSALTPAATAATRIALPAGDGGMAAGSCLAISPESLAPLPLAFQGAVQKVTGDVVTLEVTHVFRGEPGSTVEIEQPDLTAGDFSAFDFAVGQDYLIAAGDLDPAQPELEVALCGLSGPTSPELRAVYEKAFG
ncbi:MAG: hypothetical protein AAGC63_01575 [Propionicimonas sp.]|nr:hypothetical protein [Propionicimonas sp.]